MTGEDVRRIRRTLGLTQTQLGDWLRLAGSQVGHTVRMWEMGKNPVTGPVQICLEAFEQGWRPSHVLDCRDVEFQPAHSEKA